MAIGDASQEYDLLVKHQDVESGVAVTKGQVIKDEGLGFEPAGDADEGKFAVAMDTVTAIQTDRNERGLVKGVVEVTVASGFPVYFMDELVCAAAGEVKKITIDTVAKARSVVGYSMSLSNVAASGVVPILLR